MKIGITECSFSNFGEKRYEKMRGYGFRCADFNMSNTDSELYRISEGEFVRMLKNELALAKNAGIEINQVHGPWRWPPRDSTPDERKERMEKMKKSIFGTSVLECEDWVIHPIMPFGINDRGTENEAKTWKLNVEVMKELVYEAKKYGVTVCVENMPMPEFAISSPEEILKLTELVDDESFKVCFDTGHAAICVGGEIGDEVRQLGDRIRVLHIHDNNGETDLHRMPMYGIINWRDFNKALSDIGYGGVFSLEAGPAKKLPLELFEDMAGLMYRCAEMISNNLI